MSATGELVLASLWLARDARREQALARAAAAVDDWPAALLALEAHGVLGLARRNLALAGATLPPAVATELEERHARHLRIEAGFRLTLERFLAAAEARGVAVTLLKGAALVLDPYGPGALRMQGDLDLLVAPADVPAALAAARAIGLGQPAGALPTWWYRRAHFHLKLVPDDPWQRELELHWHLHPESALFAVRLEALHARRARIEVAGLPAWTLERVDRWLHLVTHLARHASLAGVGRATLVRWAGDPHAPLRVKWLLDLAAELERGGLLPQALVERAGEWNARAELAQGLALLRAIDLDDTAAEIVRAALELLPAGAPPPAGDAPEQRARPLAGFDLRASALRAFPAWLWPPRERFAGLARGRPRALARLAHAGHVLLRTALVLGATPLAWLGRTRRWSGLRPGPEDVLDLAVRARALDRAG